MLLTGDVRGPLQRRQLEVWMQANETSRLRARAAARVGRRRQDRQRR
jgi:hypothetical protein